MRDALPGGVPMSIRHEFVGVVDLVAVTESFVAFVLF